VPHILGACVYMCVELGSSYLEDLEYYEGPRVWTDSLALPERRKGTRDLKFGTSRLSVELFR
jgi:hypothetical protein